MTTETLEAPTSAFARYIPNTDEPREARERMKFLPKHFGRYMMVVEATVFNVAGQMLEGYTGGIWQFAEAKLNGAAFLVPPEGEHYNPKAPSPKTWHRIGGQLTCWEGYASPEATGIIVTLFALSRVWNRFPEEEALGEAYGALLEAAYKHPEAASICAAID